MTSDQKQSVIDLLDQLKEIRLSDLLVEAYPSESVNENIRIGEWNGTELLHFTNLATLQFYSELQTDEYLVLPLASTVYVDGSGVSVQLNNDLSSLINYYKQKDFSSAQIHLKRLIAYQQAYGFWNKSKVKVHNLDALALSKSEKDLELLSSKLKELASVALKQSLEIKNSIKTVDEYYRNKQIEFESLKSYLSDANQNAAQIQSILNNATELQSRLNVIHQSQENQITEINKKVDEEQNSLKETKESFNNLFMEIDVRHKVFSAALLAFQEQLSEVNSKKSDFDTRLKELHELIELESASALFNTFHKRKGELKWSMWIWGVLVIVISAGAAAWFYYVFNQVLINSGSQNSNPSIPFDWHLFLLASAKGIPAVILVYFAIQQYIKERSYLEEYAFRSAIALTINAYGDLAGSKREELISQAVGNIFSFPVTMREKSGSLFSFGTKELTDSIKDVGSTLKEIKETSIK